MKKKLRNRNKEDRDSAAFSTKAGPRDSHEYDNDSDAESCSTHLTFDDDMSSVMGEVTEITEDDALVLADKISEHLENAGHKNISIRTAALKNLQLILSKHCVAESLEKWKSTLMDVIEKNLRKTDVEATAAALLAALTSLQLGTLISEDMEPVIVHMRQLCADAAQPEVLRAQCAISIGLCTFLSCEQYSTTIDALKTLRAVWTSIKTNCPSHLLFSAALSAWSLLLDQVDPTTLQVALGDEPKLCTYMEANILDMRLSAGESLAVLYEHALDQWNTFRFPNHDHLVQMLGELATDSVKYRAKRDRRVQRFTFRQLYTALKNQEFPQIKIKFSNEELVLETAAVKLLYDVCCHILRGGMNQQLKENQLLRDLFSLGPASELGDVKMTKLQRVSMQNAVDKARSLQRAKQRDKRVGY